MPHALPEVRVQLNSTLQLSNHLDSLQNFKITFCSEVFDATQIYFSNNRLVKELFHYVLCI